MRIPILIILLCYCLISNIKAQQCSIYIQMNPLGIEGCVLPQIVATQEFLLPCSAPPGYNQLEEGDFAYIDYIETACISFCQAGNEVDITCLSLPVGVGEEEADDEIKVFPTIVQDRVYIEGEGIMKVEVYDDRGAQVMKLNEPNVLSMDVVDLEAGIYFITVLSKNQIWVKKVVKL